MRHHVAGNESVESAPPEVSEQGYAARGDDQSEHSPFRWRECPDTGSAPRLLFVVFYSTALEATQGQILSQSSIEATSGR